MRSEIDDIKDMLSGVQTFEDFESVKEDCFSMLSKLTDAVDNVESANNEIKDLFKDLSNSYYMKSVLDEFTPHIEEIEKIVY